MSLFHSVERTAQSVTVQISQPWPRWVDIFTDRDNVGRIRLRLEEAEGLYWALGSALKAARHDDIAADRQQRTR